MDDRELETRLNNRLRARFDGAPVPIELTADVRQALTTAPVRVGFNVHPRGRLLGWAGVAAAVVIALVALTLGTGVMGPAVPRTSVTPGPASSTAGPERLFVVLPPSTLPTKPVMSLAGGILAARLQALGIGTFTSRTGTAIVFTLPREGPSDELIRAVLGATGTVAFVPLPIDAYASLQPVIGDALPAGLPALFGYEGIASVKRATSDQGFPVLDITLTLAAATAFGDYTAAHTGEHFALVVDGRIVLLPVITAAIPGGQVEVSSATGEIPGRPDPSFDVTAAILVGGRLPPEWQGAEVPVIVDRQAAAAAALAAYPTADVDSVYLDAEPDGDGWRAIWRVTLTGDLPHSCPFIPVGGTPCPGPSGAVIVIDAVSGLVIDVEPLVP